jgi:hypothetical protein
MEFYKIPRNKEEIRHQCRIHSTSVSIDVILAIIEGEHRDSHHALKGGMSSCELGLGRHSDT